jgi:lipopolysaccharide transport system ATP-binding protein
LLPEGLFSLDLALFLPNPLDVYLHEKQVLIFEIFTDLNKATARGEYANEFAGIVRPLIQWETIIKSKT